MTYTTKDQAIKLKECGYNKATLNYHQIGAGLPIDNTDNEIQNRDRVDTVSAPSIYEAVEWMDSKGIWIEPRITVGKKSWYWHVYSDEGTVAEVDWSDLPKSRIAAYSAGLTAALDYLRNQIDNLK